MAPRALCLCICLVLISYSPVSAMSIQLGKSVTAYSEKIAALGSSLPLLSGYLNLGLYYMNVSIGNPPRSFRLNLDTGSSTMGVYSSACSACVASTSPNYYSLGSSTSETLVFCSDSACSLSSRAASTSQPQCINADVQDQSQSAAQCAFSVVYGDKSQMQGVLTRDIISIGSVSVSAYFGRILNSVKQGGTSGLFEPTGVDGIFGLGKSSLNCQPTCFPTVLDSFANAGYLNPYLFAMCLTSLGGTIDFGVIDPAKFTGALSYLPLLPTTAKSGIYYSVLMTSSFAGNSAISGTNKEVVFDSGSTLLIVTTDWFASFKSIVFAMGSVNATQLFGNPNLAFRMTSAAVDTWPTLTFKFLTSTVGSDGSLQYFTATLPPTMYLLPFVSNGATYYQLGITTTTSSFFIAGDVLLQNIYVAYDQTNNRLAVGTAGNCSSRLGTDFTPTSSADASPSQPDPVCGCVSCTSSGVISAGGAQVFGPYSSCPSGSGLQITDVLLQSLDSNVNDRYRVYAMNSTAALTFASSILNAAPGSSSSLSPAAGTYIASSSCVSSTGVNCCSPLLRNGGTASLPSSFSGSTTIVVHCLNNAATGACRFKYKFGSACFASAAAVTPQTSAATSVSSFSLVFSLLLLSLFSIFFC